MSFLFVIICSCIYIQIVIQLIYIKSKIKSNKMTLYYILLSTGSLHIKDQNFNG